MTDPVRRYLQLLEELFRRAGVQKRPLERKLGWSRGSVTKLCNGARDLKVGQLLLVLDALEVNPLDFYTLAHASPPEEEPLWERLLKSLETPGKPSRTLVLPEPMSRQDLESLIAETVRTILDQREAGEKR